MARKIYKWRIAGFIFKALCTLVIAAVVILLLWRIIDSNIDPREVDTITVNDKLADAYEKNDGNLDIFTQEQGKFTRGEDNYGYFAITKSIFIRDIDQIQIVFRYNNSTLKYTKEDYNLDSVPSRDDDVYDVTLTVMYDLTPENPDDNDGKTPEAVRYERFFASDMISAKKTLYNYRKFVFDGIDLDDNVIKVFADIYYVGDIDYDKDPYGLVLIYDNKTENLACKLTRNDIDAIESYKGN